MSRAAHSLNHIGQRFFRWPFVLFITCSNAQNFPKCLCRPAFIGRYHVGPAHGGLCFGVTHTIEPDRHGRADLIEQSSVAVPKGVKAPYKWRVLFNASDLRVMPRANRLPCKLA